MIARPASTKVYDGDGDLLMEKDRNDMAGESITLVPDAMPSKVPDATPRIRIMWGQHLLDDVLLGRYKSLVCAVNGRDNSHGVISQLAAMLPTSQWDEKSITAYAAHFAHPAGGSGSGSGSAARPKVLKIDMDMVEVLAILRPADSAYLTVEHLSHAFKIVAEMIAHNPRRQPSASVSFLGARANALVDENGAEPSFETVLRTMYAGGYTGDVYPPPALWRVSDVALFARYPFTRALDDLRAGGF